LKTLRQSREEFLDALPESCPGFGLALGIAQIRIRERSPFVENHAVAPTDEAEQTNQILGRRRERDDIGWVVGSLNSLHHRRRQTAKSPQWVGLIFEGTFDGGSKKKSSTLKISQGSLFTEIRPSRNPCTFDQLIKIHPGGKRTCGAVFRGLIKKIFKTRGRSTIKEENLDVDWAITSGKFKALDTPSDMVFVRASATGITNGHA
jgi:hypothetical protein